MRLIPAFLALLIPCAHAADSALKQTLEPRISGRPFAAWAAQLDSPDAKTRSAALPMIAKADADHLKPLQSKLTAIAAGLQNSGQDVARSSAILYGKLSIDPQPSSAEALILGTMIDSDPNLREMEELTLLHLAKENPAVLQKIVDKVGSEPVKLADPLQRIVATLRKQ